MELKINIRGNGACPLCRKESNCVILRKMIESVADIKEKNGASTECVIYSCPYFEEKA
jgi:hypothetical protein